MVVRRLLAALLFLPVLVSCSDDDPDSPDTGDPTTPVTSQPTPTETPPPTEPPEAGDRTKAGARAFVEYWVETLNYAMATGDTGELVELARAGCESCQSMSDTIEEIYSDGGSIESRGWRLDAVRSIDLLSESMVRTHVVFDLPAETIRRPGSKVERHAAFSNAQATLTLGWSDEQWKLVRFVRIAS